MSADWTTCRVVRDRDGDLWGHDDVGWRLLGEESFLLRLLSTEALATLGPISPVLDADGQPVVTTVGDLTARHQLARPRIRVAGREGKLKIVKPSDASPGTVTLIWGDWWEDAAPEEPCEVLP